MLDSLKDPENGEAVFNLGLVHIEKGDFEEALRDYNIFLEKIDPGYAVAYNNRGIAYFRLKKYDRAMENYNKAIELDPDSGLTYSNRGVVYSDMKQYERAIEDYNKAIELNPEHANAYTNRGTAYRDKGALERALEDYNKATELTPEDPEV